MPIIVKETSSISPIPPGMHIARCFRVVDAGTEYDERFGKERRVVIVSWEIPELRITIDGKDLPMSCSKFYTHSLDPKANLRKDLEAWRGRPFTHEELNGFDITRLLKAPCQLQIMHTEQGKTKVTSVMALPKAINGTQIPPLENPPVEYSVDSGKGAAYALLPEWIRTRCDKCLEWNGPGPAQADPPNDPPVEPEPTDIPF